MKNQKVKNFHVVHFTGDSTGFFLYFLKTEHQKWVKMRIYEMSREAATGGVL